MNPRIAVIGAGFGGLAAVIELKKRGYDDIVVLEKAADVGGVWRENTYPGAACDVPSPFYSFSYEPNPRWPHRFSRQPAILDYMHDVADKYGVSRHIRFGVEVTAATFDEAAGAWTLSLSSGEPLIVDVLVSAVGQLSRPSIPDVDGRASFGGPAFHSATWDHDVDLSGRSVAVVGTGASAIQFIPAIQPEVAHLTVFQRSAPHLMPRPDREFTELHHRVFEALPVTERAERLTWYGMVEFLSIAWIHSPLIARILRARSRRHMRTQAETKPGLFEQIWPEYPMGCKRVLFSDDYVPALAQPNVEVVTDPIASVTPSGVVTADGVEYPADVLIWGTGFKVQEFLAPITITGVGGRELHEVWKDGARAYYGLTVPHFPNLLVMYGPNTNTGGGSIIYFLEVQAKYVADFVDELAETGRPLAVRAEVEAAYDAQLQDELGSSIWSQCASWYRQANGRITANWPRLGIQYRSQAKFDRNDYEVVA
jgi:cation diffusion facilitator CzcD-associated flavoprotein CzcO